MTNRSAAALALKVWGVIWLVHALSGFLNAGFQLASISHEENASLWAYAVRTNTISAVFTFLVGLTLVRGGDAIARRLFREEEPFAVALDESALRRIAFSVLGLYFGMSALRSVASGAYALLTRPPEERVAFVWRENKQHVAGALLELAAAVVLFFGTPALVRLFKRLQEPWTRPPVDDDSSPGAEGPGTEKPSP